MKSLQLTTWKQIGLTACVTCALLALTLSVPAEPVHASSFAVTNTNDDGAGSLRQAILDANASPGADKITFAIGTGAQSIEPLSALPQITDAVTIDGTSQPGYSGTPLIELDGEGAGYGIGLDIAADNCTIQGLVINRFGVNGIRLVGSNNLITHNYIGTNIAGTADLGNGSSGIFLNALTASADNVIRDNLISGNDWDGITLQGMATGTVIQGNKIGTSADGLAQIANVDNGMWLGPGGGNTQVGGTETGEGNLIAGNGWNGITIDHSTGPTLVQGNLIGVNAPGTQGLGNYAAGIFSNAANTTIGGTTSAARNIVSGNAWAISLYGTTGAVVKGNFIGTDKTGTVGLGNYFYGIWVNNAATDSQIGGPEAGAMNVISANGQFGIYLTDAGTQSTHIEGNRIGTTADGTAKLGNGQNGIWVQSNTSDTGIGGTSAGAGNLISGNGWNGIANNYNASIVVQGNWIGTNAAGNACLGNGGEGIFLTTAATVSGNVIGCNASDGIEVCGGGACPEVPSASRAVNDINNEMIPPLNNVSNPAIKNPLPGLETIASQPGKDFTTSTPNQTTETFATIQNNHIGTDVTGTLNLGNAEEGIVLWYIDGNQVTGNVIAFNPGYGIHAASGSGNVIQQNSIVSNGKDGVYVTGIGGNTLLENSIANNSRDGVRIEASSNQIKNNSIVTNGENGVMVVIGSANALRGNSITSNGALGIDLAPEGVTPNDAGDKDKGVNKKQNFPVLAAASSKTGKVTGMLNSIPNKSFTIEFFANDACDSNRYGEGKTLLGQKNVKTDAVGNINFTFKTAGLVAGQFVSATATDAKGNTSEFSKCIKIK